MLTNRRKLLELVIKIYTSSTLLKYYNGILNQMQSRYFQKAIEQYIFPTLTSFKWTKILVKY